MSNAKSKKACATCYQKKVRCDWPEDATKCVFCASHDLQCYVPNPAKPVQRTAVRDQLSDILVRLERLESQRMSTDQFFSVPESDVHSTMATSVHTSTPGIIVPVSGGSNIGLNSRDELELRSKSIEQVSISSHRGQSSPWQFLTSSIESTPSRVDTAELREHVEQLAKEDRTTFQKSKFFSWNLLEEFPHLTSEIVMIYTSYFALEAPFMTLHWPTFKITIEQGLKSGIWASRGQIVCILLYLAFGVIHVNKGEREECELFFGRAWSMLPDLILYQDLWTLKAMTLMVHYLQGGALPEPCYTLIGSAIRIAIGQGLHEESGNIDQSDFVELEEARRSLWLCYIMDVTLSIVLGRPSIDLDMTKVSRPRIFCEMNSDESHTIGNFFEADEESTSLFNETIQVVQLRRALLTKSPSPKHYLQNEDSSHNLRDTLAKFSELKASSQLEHSDSLRSAIYRLCYNTSIIVTDRLLSEGRTNTITSESIQAARHSIILIQESHSKGLTLCLWMWLYYGFTSTVALFINVVTEPLHPDATLHLALIADVENICVDLQNYSPGARRVMEVTREMGKVGFQIMKSSAKRKASDDLQPTGNEKAARVESASRLLRSDQSAGDDSMTGFEGEFSWAEMPSDFSWENWDQYFGSITPPQ